MDSIFITCFPRIGNLSNKGRGGVTLVRLMLMSQTNQVVFESELKLVMDSVLTVEVSVSEVWD